MFNALVWSFAFDLRDMSKEVCVSALSSLLFFIERRLCIDGVDWLLKMRDSKPKSELKTILSTYFPKRLAIRLADTLLTLIMTLNNCLNT
jgi:hypothetical protein